MYQRQRILDLWAKAGLDKSPNKQVRDFIRFVERSPNLGWEGYAEKCRREYPNAIRELVAPLLDSGDNLLVTNILRNANVRRGTEREVLRAFAREADPGKHALALEMLAKTGTASIKQELTARTVLPGRVKQLLVEQDLAARGLLQPAPSVPGTTHDIR